MQESQSMLLQLPVALSAFARVQVQQLGQLPAVSADDELEEAATPPSICTESRITKLHAIAHQVQQKQPGGPLVAYPCTAGYCQALVVNVYKGLLAQQSQLHIKLSGVKSSIFKPPLPNIQLEAALNVAVQSQLTQHGWSQLDRQQLVTGNIWDQQASGQQACQSVKLSVACQAPGFVVMRIQTGLVTLKRFDPRHVLPANLAAGSSLQELLLGSLSAINKAVEGLPCSLLPDGRPGIISHLSVTIPETLQSVQQHWLTLYGSQLPDDVPYIMHIRHVDDYDAPTTPYPSCCVLMPGGFSYTPHQAGAHQQCLVLKQVADALAMPNPFWKGAASVLLHKHSFNPPLAPPADKQTHAASSGWATAAQRHRETPSQPTQTAAAATFQPSDYLPAEQVCAAAPKAPDTRTVLVKRPRRPKVEVSPGLKLLLQSSAELQQQQQQLALVPSKQPAVSLPLPQQNAGATPPGQIVLKKRSQYTASASAAPRLAQGQPGAHTAGGQAPGKPQASGSAAMTPTMQGSKRSAVPAGTSVVPALLKRPKLAAHAKPPASKPGASQVKGTAAAAAKAAGKATTAKKASAVPKAPTKVPAAASVPTSSAVPQSGQVMATLDAHAAQGSLAGTAAASAAAAKTLGVSTAQAASAAASAAASGEGAPAPAGTAAPTKALRQRKKAEDIDLAEVEKKIREKQAAGRLQDISIPELKCFLKARKLPVGGKKAELLARVEPLLGTA